MGLYFFFVLSDLTLTAPVILLCFKSISPDPEQIYSCEAVSDLGRRAGSNLSPDPEQIYTCEAVSDLGRRVGSNLSPDPEQIYTCEAVSDLGRRVGSNLTAKFACKKDREDFKEVIFIRMS